MFLFAVGTASGQVQGVSKRMLDPRRPHTETAEDKEEGLIPFKPVLVVGPEQTVTLNQTVPHLHTLISFPTPLESATQVLAIGTDLFFSTVTPSGSFDSLTDEFLRAPLVITIVALVAGVIYARGASNKKRLAHAWK